MRQWSSDATAWQIAILWNWNVRGVHMAVGNGITFSHEGNHCNFQFGDLACTDRGVPMDTCYLERIKRVRQGMSWI